MQTINLTLDTPSGIDTEWLKQKLYDYAEALIKTLQGEKEESQIGDYVPCGIYGKPLTMAEINARIDQSERDIADGKGIPTEEFEEELFEHIKMLAS